MRGLLLDRGRLLAFIREERLIKLQCVGGGGREFNRL